LALAAVIMLVWTLAWGVADRFHSLAERHLSGAVAGDRDRALKEAAAAVAMARGLQPLAPEYRRTAGLILELQARGPAATRPRVLTLLTRAEMEYGRDVRLRPAWPFGYGDLVRVRLARGDLGPDLDHALARALALGRWEPGLQRSLSATVLARWARLSGTTRRRLQPLLSAGLRLQPTAMLALARDRGRLAVMRPLIAGDARLEALALQLQAASAGR
jgi:hypothetical protein